MNSEKDELSEFRKRKYSPSKLKMLGLDKVFSPGVKCKNCHKVFYKFSEVYVAWLEAKVPCCPFCKANVLDTEVF